MIKIKVKTNQLRNFSLYHAQLKKNRATLFIHNNFIINIVITIRSLMTFCLISVNFLVSILIDFIVTK